MNTPHAFLLTWTTYGTWLHGDERGSVDDEHNRRPHPPVHPDQWRREWSAAQLTEVPLVLDLAMRHAVDTVVRKHCAVRMWPLIAVNVRSNHVHTVVGWRGVEPEVVMQQLKSWSTRALRPFAALERRKRFWTAHGSTRYLWDDRSMHDAARYVLERQ